MPMRAKTLKHTLIQPFAILCVITSAYFYNYLNINNLKIKTMTIDELIKDQIEQLDIKSMVQYEIKKLISDDVKREITKITKEEIQRIIKTEIEICMSKGVQTDDGWGKRENYTSFEELFKKHFKTALDSTYEVKKTIENHVKQTTETLVKEQTKQIVDALKKTLGA